MTEQFEREGYAEETPVDTIWVRDGRGMLIEVEVEDDATDD